MSAARGLALLLLLALAACAPASGGPSAVPAGDQPAPPSATPVASLTPNMATTVAALRASLGGAALRLLPATRVYRASEPASLAQVPRAVQQVDLSDPDLGWVVIYELRDPAAAAARGQEFAAFLGSGFGQTNYPLDAQFALVQRDATLVFTWWSRSRASDPARAEQAFDLLSRSGTSIPVRK